MRSKPASGERPLYWVASSKKDLLAMPNAVVRRIGVALGVAQQGGVHPSAKPWKGEGPGVMEIVSEFDGNTYRGHLHGEISRSDLRFALFSEEVADRHQNCKSRC